MGRPSSRRGRPAGPAPSCTGEVRGLREVTTELAMAAALRPPPALHGRVLAAVSQTRQLAPADGAQPRHERPAGRRAAKWRPGQWSGWLPRFAIGVAAAGVAVAVSRAERELIVTTAGLHPLPAGKVYEAWLINPRQTRSAGLLPVPRGGRTRPVLATGLAPGDALGLTVEPAGGSAKPTTTPIVVMPLRA